VPDGVKQLHSNVVLPKSASVLPPDPATADDVPERPGNALDGTTGVDPPQLHSSVPNTTVAASAAAFRRVTSKFNIDLPRPDADVLIELEWKRRRS
jgi:hypothetical protein